MSSFTTTGDYFVEFIKGLQEILDNPVKITDPLDTDFVNGGDSHKRHERQFERPTPLQFRYDRQVRETRRIRPELINAMSNLVAWTWLPGQDRQVCPDFVSIRDPRLVTMDRFPDRPGAQPNHIGLSVYRISVTKRGCIQHGGSNNCEMFKDLFFRPHAGAGGVCLDSRNETILRAALTLDWAMECTARGWMPPCKTFDPPQVYHGFNHHYSPNPDEWRPAMQDAMRQVFHPDSPHLKCLLSPGGTITSINDVDGPFKAVTIERNGTKLSASHSHLVQADRARTAR